MKRESTHGITRRDLEICAALKREADDLREMIARLRARLEDGPRSGIGLIPKGQRAKERRAEDSLGAMVEALLELEALYGEKIRHYAEHVRAVENAIDAIGAPDVRRVMRLRYVLGMTWAEVGEKAGYDPRWCQRLGERGERELIVYNKF